ncbi:MAG: DUF3536 domain-containing protein [Firmicutes bacterium]|uniref:Glycoside hydrolase n=1 Tax=Sulfobacillus benefaciens TaxID=453960 RepID=A0A2T2XAE9_9FIRM|nr:DUF3536 domain-containing protein [Bacillota bacterium]MCL5014354.1 DUF3536 domain-containing protein [Bacillota bacterium]PSR31459.1 MAG: glycoside hydrolase [Sulfobacillus benefaciens]
MEQEESARPYHDWNQRITEECYAPNSHARILDGNGRLCGVSNNYSNISFNFGPTLLAWLQRHEPETYLAILEGDQWSQKRFGSHGSALAQVYNHIIMPLATSRDKEVEIIWGIRDFVHRFQRYPEGMWLAETAVDYETLWLLAKHGIKFTILSPDQALRIRDPRGECINVEGGKISTSRPYLVELPDRQTIAVFFYHAALSRAVAFEGLLNDGPYFASRLMEGFDPSETGNQLVHIATDGETYGHHHRFGEMALAYALDVISGRDDVRLTNYGEYLALNPPVWKAEIIENTSWSCAHGIERWRSDCGCQSGLHPAWTQKWRTPLRQAMDYVRDTVTPLFDALAPRWLKDPAQAFQDYIDVILNREQNTLNAFILQHQAQSLDLEDTIRVFQLMELYRHILLMYTSCGWFFDDIGGLEAIQVMKYAARAIQLGERLFDVPMEASFREILEQARSNEGNQDGRTIFDNAVTEHMVSLPRVALHYSMMHLLMPYDRGSTTTIYCYDVYAGEEVLWRSGPVKMAVGQVQVISETTLDRGTFNYAVLHLGDHNVIAGVRTYRGPELYQTMLEQLSRAFHAAEFPEVIRLLDQFFQGHTNSLRHLFPDEQELVIHQLVSNSLEEALTYNRHIYEHSISFMRFLKDMDQNIPGVLWNAAAVSIRDQFQKQLNSENVNIEEVRRLLAEAREWNLLDDWDDLAYHYEMFIKRLSRQLNLEPNRLQWLEILTHAVELAQHESLQIDLQEAQLAVFRLTGTALEDPDETKQWQQYVMQLDTLLAIRRD